MVTPLLRRPEVQSLTSLSRSSLFALVAAGRFPRPVRVSSRRVAWLQTDIEAWLAEKVSARDAGNSKALVQQR